MVGDEEAVRVDLRAGAATAAPTASSPAWAISGVGAIATKNTQREPSRHENAPPLSAGPGEGPAELTELGEQQARFRPRSERREERVDRGAVQPAEQRGKRMIRYDVVTSSGACADRSAQWRRTGSACWMSHSIMPAKTSAIGYSRSSSAVTTPKLPPPSE